MNDATETPGAKRPPRAEPLQPDLPGSGDEKEETPAEGNAAADERQRRQSTDALDNISKGYD